MPTSIRSARVFVSSAVRTTTLIIGITCGLLLVLEASCRIWLAWRDSSRRPVASLAVGPLAGKPWVAQFNREFDATREVAWRPFVYFRRNPSFRGQFINIDSLGHRVTPQPLTPERPAARVFFMGGSTMWGSFQRDDHTIPAEASRRLQALIGPGERVEVTNFGEQGWVNSQEIIELMLQLREGNRPDVVVFVDGINDPFATLQAGRAGIPQNEHKRVAEFAMGRKLDRTLYGPGLATDLRAGGVLLVAALQHLELVHQLQGMLPHPQAAQISADSAIRSLVRVYSENVRLVEALAAAYHFTPLYVWQPTLQATDKRLTVFEHELLRASYDNGRLSRLGEVYRMLPPRLDSAMATLVPDRFVDATHAFKDDTASAFTDVVGHNAEEAVPILVDAFWPRLREILVARSRVQSAHRR